MKGQVVEAQSDARQPEQGVADPSHKSESERRGLRRGQFMGIYEHMARMACRAFNEMGGVRPMVVWVALESRVSTTPRAMGEVMSLADAERLFKSPLVGDELREIVKRAFEQGAHQGATNGRQIDAVVVIGEATVRESDQKEAREAVGIWVHSETRTEFGSMPIKKEGAKRTCQLATMKMTPNGRTGPLTMVP